MRPTPASCTYRRLCSLYVAPVEDSMRWKSCSYVRSGDVVSEGWVDAAEVAKTHQSTRSNLEIT